MKKSVTLAAALLVTAALTGGYAYSTASAATITVGSGNSQETGGPNAFSLLSLLTEEKTTQYFEDTAVSDDDVRTILQAGINAPSAMNQQSWHFSVVTSEEILQQIAEDMSAELPAGIMASASGTVAKAGIADAPLAIVISSGNDRDFDAGLACQNMSVAALALGYGTKIISSPTIALNGDKQDAYREQLGIPADMEAVAVLLVGTKADTSSLGTDAITGPTTRNSFDSTVTYIN
ncbi:MAG: nitroreductase family protein [Clostridiales bacterium]|nr:nitroreductase family protein [Clostridiales bacterium]